MQNTYQSPCSIIFQSTWIWIFHSLSLSVMCCKNYHFFQNWNISRKKREIVKIFISHKLHNWNVFLGVFTPHFMLMELFQSIFYILCICDIYCFRNIRLCIDENNIFLKFIWNFYEGTTSHPFRNFNSNMNRIFFWISICLKWSFCRYCKRSFPWSLSQFSYIVIIIINLQRFDSFSIILIKVRILLFRFPWKFPSCHD